MGCVKIIGYRNSSFVTFWWSLLVLTAPGPLPSLNDSRWRVINPAYRSGVSLEVGSAPSCPQGQHEPCQIAGQGSRGTSTQRDEPQTRLAIAVVDLVQLCRFGLFHNLPLFRLNKKSVFCKREISVYLPLVAVPNHLTCFYVRGIKTRREKPKGQELSPCSLNTLKLRAGSGGASKSMPAACSLILPPTRAPARSRQRFSSCPQSPSGQGKAPKRAARCSGKASPSGTNHCGTNIRNIFLLNSAVSYMAVFFTLRHITSIMENT